MKNQMIKKSPAGLKQISDYLRSLGKKWLKVTAFCTVLLFFLFPCTQTFAADNGNTVSVNIGGSDDNIIDIIIMLTIIALIPTLVLMASAFTRIIIVLSFLRSALGTQQSPPNQVLIGLALVLTMFVMSPTISQINETAYQPYREQKITQEECLEKAQKPLKEFMLKQTTNDDLDLFLDISKTEIKEDTEKTDLPWTVIISAFVTSELKRAFLIGFLLYIPFLIIDMIVASTLMSMGMMMLPPSMISLPFKLLLFVLVDGWGLLFKSLVMSFNL